MEHVGPHAIPTGLLVTVPLPVVLTVSVRSGTNIAVTVVFAVSVNTQVSVVPLHAPSHRPKVQPAPGVAVSVTEVSLGKDVEHVEGQAIPTGVLVMLPCPETDDVSVTVGGCADPVVQSSDRLLLRGVACVSYVVAWSGETWIPTVADRPPSEASQAPLKEVSA